MLAPRAPGQALRRAGGRQGKAHFPCHCGGQQQPLGSRESSWRAVQASHDEEKQSKRSKVKEREDRGSSEVKVCWGNMIEGEKRWQEGGDTV